MASGETRVRVVDETGAHEMFEVVDQRDGVLRVRAAYRFEIGEELKVRVEQNGESYDATAQVRVYTTDGLAEIEISDRSDVRSIVSG